MPHEPDDMFPLQRLNLFFFQICFEIPQLASQSYTHVLLLILHLPSLVMPVR